MAKTNKKVAVKKATAKTPVTKINLAPPAVDTTELKELLVDLENLVPGSGTVEQRQQAVDKLKGIILKFEG